MIKQFLFSFRNLCLFILKNKVIAANDNLLTCNRGRNAMCYKVFHLGMHLFMYQTSSGCLTNHCLRHGMRKMLFKTCRYRKQFIFGLIIERHNIHNCRLCLRQCTRFIKNDGFGFCHSLDVFTTLDCDIVAACFPDR